MDTLLLELRKRRTRFSGNVQIRNPRFRVRKLVSKAILKGTLHGKGSQSMRDALEARIDFDGRRATFPREQIP